MLRQLALVVILSCAVPAAAADPASEQARLEGNWTAISAEREGAAAAELVGHRLEFASKRFRITVEGRILAVGSYAVDPAPQPPQIDFQHEEGGAAGATWQGIYRLEDDTLTICDNAVDVTKPRPTELTTRPGSDHVLLVFRALELCEDIYAASGRAWLAAMGGDRGREAGLSACSPRPCPHERCCRLLPEPPLGKGRARATAPD